MLKFFPMTEKDANLSVSINTQVNFIVVLAFKFSNLVFNHIFRML